VRPENAPEEHSSPIQPLRAIVLVMRIVRHTEQELVVKDGSPIASALLCIGCGIVFFASPTSGWWHLESYIAIFLVILSPPMRGKITVFDLAAGVVRWKDRRIFKSTSGSLAISEVKGIGMARIVGDRSSAPYRLAILTSQDPIPLEFSEYPLLDRHRQIRETIQRFLNIDPATSPVFEPDSVDDAPIRALIREGRKIEAIRLVIKTNHVGVREAKDRVDALTSKMDATL
jgi:hypothetical protein